MTFLVLKPPLRSCYPHRLILDGASSRSRYKVRRFYFRAPMCCAHKLGISCDQYCFSFFPFQYKIFKEVIKPIPQKKPLSETPMQYPMNSIILPPLQEVS